jgi:hypothetical protein
MMTATATAMAMAAAASRVGQLICSLSRPRLWRPGATYTRPDFFPQRLDGPVIYEFWI